MTKERLAEIKARLKAATPGPWQVYPTEIPYRYVSQVPGAGKEEVRGAHIHRQIGTEYDHPQLHGPAPVVTLSSGIGTPEGGGVQMVGIEQKDAELIAHAPRDLEDLLDALETAHRQLEFYRQTYAGE